MGAKIWIGIKSRAAHLRRLSVVFAIELRLKIVTELYMREMSPKQFHEEFGGGTLARVSQNFEKLQEHGWLRHIRSEPPGGNRRGKTEHFYRATELAFFDRETWALLPYSVRVAFSWNSFKQIAMRLREAMEAGTFDAGPTRNLTSEQLLLDEIGWERVIEANDAQFVSLFEEQDDARLRVSHSSEQLIRASIVQIAFECPAQGSELKGPSLVESLKEHPVPFPIRLSKVFADEACLQIVAQANQREISVTQFCKEFGGSKGSTWYRFKRLEKIGWLKSVNSKTGGKRRGTAEKFYRATGPAIFDIKKGPWTDVPASLAGTDTWKTFEQLSAEVKESMKAGVFDAREDGCLAWSLLELDQQGWQKMAAELETLLAFALDEQKRAKIRMAKSGEKPVRMMIALAAFESPKELEKEP